MKNISLAAACAAAGLAMALTGCGSHPSASSSSAPPTTTPTTATVTQTAPATTVPAPASSSPAASPLPAFCLTSELRVTFDLGRGAGGSQYSGLHVVNVGGRTCTVTGYPGVSEVAPGNGQQIGAAAVRDTASAPAISLAPGAEASTLYVTANNPPTGCMLVTAAGLRVYPPDNTSAVYVPFASPSQVCPEVAGGMIYPLRAGATFDESSYS